MDVSVDPGGLQAFGQQVSGALTAACGAIEAASAGAAGAVSWRDDALNRFAGHWDVELELITTRLMQLGKYCEIVAAQQQQLQSELAESVGP